MSEEENHFETTPYKESGLVCEVCGYTDSLKCYIDVPIDDVEENNPAQILCGEHAADNGYCCCCGLFYCGTSGWGHHPGYCDNCYDEVSDDEGGFDDEDDIHELDY